MKCKIYVNDVHTLTVDKGDVGPMVKWLKDIGAADKTKVSGYTVKGGSSMERQIWVADEV